MSSRDILLHVPARQILLVSHKVKYKKIHSSAESKVERRYIKIISYLTLFKHVGREASVRMPILQKLNLTKKLSFMLSYQALDLIILM